MEEEKYLNPQPKSDHQIQPATKAATPRKEEGSSKTPVYLLLAVVLLSIGFLIFGLVFLRINAPSLRLSNVVVRDLRFNSSSLSMTFIADFTLRNMNFGRFDFHGGTAALLYGNATLGEATIHGGRLGSRGRRRIGSATMEVMAGPSANYMNISTDIESNFVRVMSVAELRGEIRVMKIMNRWRTASMNCSMELNLSDQQVQGLSCR